MKEKHFSDEMLKKYISSEISIIEKRRKDSSQWNRNEEFHSQITIRMEGDNNVPKISDGEL